MKNYGFTYDNRLFYVEVAGRIWMGYSMWYYSDDFAYIKSVPCDCAGHLSLWMRKEMRKNGINVDEKSPSFYHDGSNPPSDEEWDEIRRTYGFRRPRRRPPKQSPPKQQSQITSWLNSYPTDFGKDYQ
jgi:hypothetical protein